MRVRLRGSGNARTAETFAPPGQHCRSMSTDPDRDNHARIPACPERPRLMCTRANALFSILHYVGPILTQASNFPYVALLNGRTKSE